MTTMMSMMMMMMKMMLGPPPRAQQLANLTLTEEGCLRGRVFG